MFPINDIDKVYRRGTHRTRPPDETVRELRPWLAVAGITRVANVTGLDILGVPVVQACRPNARSLSVSQGKGLTLEAAKASAIMESLELYHAERIQRPLERASLREISLRRPLIDLTGLEPAAPSIWHPDRRMLWIEGRELMSETSIWLPFEVVHMDFTVPLPDGSGCFKMSSNGLASGNHSFEALSHGLCEVIERDALARWQGLSRRRRAERRVHLETVHDTDCRLLLRRFAEAGLTVAVWDVTPPVGVPTYLCEMAPNPSETWLLPEVCSGQGSHLDPGIALSRALTEAAQSRLTRIAGSRDDIDIEGLRRTRQPDLLRDRVGRLEAERPTGDAGVDFSKSLDLSRGTLGEDVDLLLERLKATNLQQAVAVDLSLPGFPVAVTRVVVPHLRNTLR